MAEMLKSLEMNRVSYQRIGSYGLKCHKNTVRFEMEITHMQDLDNIFVVKFKRLAGEMPQYKEVSGRVLQNMNLSLPSNSSGLAAPPNYVYWSWIKIIYIINLCKNLNLNIEGRIISPLLWRRTRITVQWACWWRVSCWDRCWSMRRPQRPQPP